MKQKDAVRKDQQPLTPEDRLTQVMLNLSSLQVKITKQHDPAKKKALGWQIKCCLAGINRLQSNIGR